MRFIIRKSIKRYQNDPKSIKTMGYIYSGRWEGDGDESAYINPFSHLDVPYA
jgi:hypothetical protein